jgi:hypothetical protein
MRFSSRNYLVACTWRFMRYFGPGSYFGSKGRQSGGDRYGEAQHAYRSFERANRDVRRGRGVRCDLHRACRCRHRCGENPSRRGRSGKSVQRRADCRGLSEYRLIVHNRPRRPLRPGRRDDHQRTHNHPRSRFHGRRHHRAQQWRAFVRSRRRFHGKHRPVQQRFPGPAPIWKRRWLRRPHVTRDEQ